ncbi:hypothetical protein HK101_006160, partial [Irineochytrium annulatum]
MRKELGRERRKREDAEIRAGIFEGERDRVEVERDRWAREWRDERRRADELADLCGRQALQIERVKGPAKVYATSATQASQSLGDVSITATPNTIAATAAQASSISTDVTVLAAPRSSTTTATTFTPATTVIASLPSAAAENATSNLKASVTTPGGSSPVRAPPSPPHSSKSTSPVTSSASTRPNATPAASEALFLAGLKSVGAGATPLAPASDEVSAPRIRLVIPTSTELTTPSFLEMSRPIIIIGSRSRGLVLDWAVEQALLLRTGRSGWAGR